MGLAGGMGVTPDLGGSLVLPATGEVIVRCSPLSPPKVLFTRLIV